MWQIAKFTQKTVDSPRKSTSYYCLYLSSFQGDVNVKLILILSYPDT